MIQASQYRSLHQIPLEFYYKDGVLEGAVKRTGFKNQFDLDDTIIRCSDASFECAFKNSYTLTFGPETEIPTFKIFVPPGAKAVNLSVYLSGQTSQYGFVARLGQPPEGDYGGYFSCMSPDTFITLNSAGTTQKNLLAGDCIGRNAAGIMTILNTGFSVENESQGGWLYVATYRITGSVIRGPSGSIVVTTDTFVDWFRSAQWQSNGDPLEGVSAPVTVGPVSISRSKLSFEGVKVGEKSSPVSFDLKSISESSTDITVSYPLGFSGDWSGGLLSAGESKTVNVVFSPITEQEYSGSIAITAGGKAFSLPVTGNGSNSETATSDLQKIIQDLTKKLGNVVQSKKNVDKMIESLQATKAVVTDAAQNETVSSLPAAAAIVDFHVTKLAGSFGTYGIDSQLNSLQSMSTAMDNEKTFYELAIEVYNCLDKGIPIRADIPYPPGYDVDASALYNKDMDSPASKYQMQLKADLSLQDRPKDLSVTGPLPYILPENPKKGDLVCLSGVEFICDEFGEFFPVGLQEPYEMSCLLFNSTHASCIDDTTGGT